MMRIALRTASAFALLAVAAAPALAEDPPRPPAPPGAGASAGTTVRVKSILGSKVSLRGGARAGTVEDIVLSNEGVVDYLIVSRGDKLVTVPWDAAKFNYAKRMATIDVTQDQYEKVPTFTNDRYPDFYTPAYRGQLYKSYGLTPGQERRLERRANRRP